ncbi:MAG: DUF2791 family P-loop domain-containing protein [Deltaproteobacteria bacterium]|nr:DUF2791 family P-loop domain-containing protein [Deltaproteobacteria bacterium]
MITNDTISPELARHILQRVGESGQPPEQGIAHLNVGNDSYLRILEAEYLTRLARNPLGSSFKLVQGYYGGGKTHFLYCVRDLAWRHGLLTAIVNLSPRECPYDDAVKIYGAVAAALSAPPVSEPSAPTRGLTDVLRDLVDDRRAALGEARAREWIQKTAARVAVESHSFRKAAAGFMEACLEGDAARQAVLEPWLLGEPVPATDTRPLGVYECLEPSTGFRMLRSLCQAVAGYGLAGTVMLFDEVDRNLSLTSRKMHAVGDNLRQVIDLCGQARLPATLFLYAVPPEFLRNVVPEYPALEQRLRSPVPLSERSPQAAVIDLERLDLEPVALLTAIGQRLLRIFAAATSWTPDAAAEEQNCALLAETMAAHTFEVSHRRLFVKTYVDFLHQQQRGKPRTLDAAQANAIVQGGYLALGTLADEFADA